MSHTKDQISIRKYNEMLRDVIFQEGLFPDSFLEKEFFHMDINEDMRLRAILIQDHPCSSEYLEYFWVEFKYDENEYVVSLFYRDFDCTRGDIHVMPGVLQVWKKTPYSEGEEYKFPSGRQIEAYAQTVMVSTSETIIWKPLIDYGKMKSKKFVWAPFMDLNRLSEFIIGIIDNSKYEISVSDDENNKQEENLGKLEYINAPPNSEGEYKKPTIGNYKYLYRWTRNYEFQGNKYFISPYKHINTDYGYFIRFDGKPTAYMIKHACKYPNELQRSSFVINYDYADAAEVIKASNN